jgi:hypothetical protein
MAFEWHPPILNPDNGFMSVCGIASRSGIQPYIAEDGSVKGVYRASDFVRAMAEKFAEGKSGLILQHTDFNPSNLDAGIGWVNDGVFSEVNDEGFALFEAVITDHNTIDEIQKQGESLNLPVSPSYKHQLKKPSKPQYWKDSLGLVGTPSDEYVYIEEQTGDPTVDNLAVVDYGRGGKFVGIFYNNPLDELVNKQSSGIYNNDDNIPFKEGDIEVENSADSTLLYPYPHTEDDSMKEVLDALAPMAEKMQKNCDAIDKMCDAMNKLCDGMGGISKMTDSLDRLESQITGLAGDIKSSRENQELKVSEQLGKQEPMKSAVASNAYTAGSDSAPEAEAADAAPEVKEDKSQDALMTALDRITTLAEKLAERPATSDASYVPAYVGAKKAGGVGSVTKSSGGGFEVKL